MTFQQTEVAVVGGGMIGSALTLGLALLGLKVTVIEHTAPPAFSFSSLPDIRISAIGVASVDLMRGLGVWNNVHNIRAHSYSKLEAWEWDGAKVVFDASELKIPRLGYMIENNVLQRALWCELELHPNVTLKAPASLTTLRRDNEGYRLILNDIEEITVKLVVGADGANSLVRQMANIGVHAWEYQLSCILITVRCKNDPGDSTWLHFTPNGPRAFLPLFDYWASLIWYDIPERIRLLQEMSMSLLAREIMRHFPIRLGKVEPLATCSFPLIRRHALRYVDEGLVLVGDAAHTVHPLAGQGANLGYRDVKALLETIKLARTIGEKWTSQKVLLRYQRRRMIDNLVMLSIIDLFHIGFSNDLKPVGLLRNIGMVVAERTKILKRQVLRYALNL